MPQELLEHEYTVKNKIYHPHDPITSVCSVIEELLQLSDITGTSYTQHKSMNMAYVIIHSTGKFSMSIH